jgi:hypothetical protein
VDRFFVESLGAILAIAAFILVGVVVLAIVVLATNRAEPDATGRRTLATYLAVVNFVAIFTIVFASFATVSSLTRLIVDEKAQASSSSPFSDSGAFSSSDDKNDAAVRGAVQGVLVVGAAVVVLVFHSRRRRELQLASDFTEGSPPWRIDRAFSYTVCFVAVLVALFSIGFGAYGIFRLVAPGVTTNTLPRKFERQEALATLLSLAFLGLTTLYVFRRHWREIAPPPATS